MRFIAVLDDCNDSKEAGNDQMQEEGEGERIRRRREEEREEGRKREREKERKEGRKSALGERGARSTCTLYERNPRRRRWAVVHFIHAYVRLS